MNDSLVVTVIAVVGFVSITAFLWVDDMTDIWQQRQADWDQREQALSKADSLAVIRRDDKDTIWAKACDEYLADHQLCDECDKRGHTVIADTVGHIRDPKNNPVTFWDMNNWRALCTSCHRRLVGNAAVKIPNPIPESANLYRVK